MEGLTSFAALLLIVTCTSASILKRPYELELHHLHAVKSGADTCSFISIRETQLHKDVRNGRDDLLSISGNFFHGDQQNERIYRQYFSYDIDLLWETAISNCGPIQFWSFPVFVTSDIPFPHPLYSQNDGQAAFATEKIKPAIGTLAPVPPLEVFPISSSGPSSNRVDFVFFGDGYTEEEKGKFLEDAERLAFDISNNQTFATVKPLLNFWAAFTPSNESGVGVGGEVKDTPFGLYREGTELRALYYAKPEVAHAACLSLGDRCDYPVLLGNDPLYGGLGGRFTVTTSSIANGALVLRHELGHSVIREGEEYDGGFAYYGTNAANLTHPFKWRHWLTNESKYPPREEHSVMPIQAYPWTMLNDSDPWSLSFSSSGLYSRFVIRFSLSGLPNESDLNVTLDGRDLHWKPKEGLGVDRWHYDIHINETLQAGTHIVAFELKNADLVGVAQLCSAEVIEFGAADEFNSSPGFIGAFPTWSETNVTTYRPTNEGCLMRIVTTPTFCKVCIEGLWHALLRRVDLVDTVSTNCSVDPSSTPRRTIETKLLDLAQFRKEPVEHAEAYIIEWEKDGVELVEFVNQTFIRVDGGPATYTAHVRFVTDEVRVDPGDYLKSTVDIEVPQCGL